MKPLVIVGLVGVLIGAVAGWLLIRPSEDWRVWRDQVVAYQQREAEHLMRQDSLRAGRDSAIARADSAEVRARRSQAQADHERSRRLAYQQQADSFKVLLANAVTPADSLASCMGELFARRVEAAACATETARLRSTVQQDSVGLRERAKALETERQAHQETIARLRRADSLLVIAPQPRRCALPICASLLLTLEPWDRTFFAGVVIPIRTWIGVGPVRRLTK